MIARTRTSALSAVGPTVVLLLAAGGAHAQCTYSTVTAPDKAAGDRFGQSVALARAGSLSLLIVGAPLEDNAAGTDAGSVYSYSWTGMAWTLGKKLIADGLKASDHFGKAVAFSEPDLVVGSPDARSGGMVHMFLRDGTSWFPTGEFISEYTADHLGTSVAVSGWYCVAGAPDRDVASLADAGTLGVYSSFSGSWTLDSWLTQEFARRYAGDRLGASVGIDGAELIAGAPGGDTSGLANCGYAQSFVLDGSARWVAGTQFLAPDKAKDDEFGAAVAIRGDLAAIGAPGADVSGKMNAGAVYLFRRTGTSWSFEKKLTAADAAPGIRLGSRVAIDGARVLAAADGTDAAYLFRSLGSGKWAQDFRAGAPAAGQDFGAAAAIAEGRVVVGDPAADPAGLTDAGAAYLYTLDADVADSCEGAVPASQGSYAGCTSGLTVDGSAPCTEGKTTSPDVWFSYTAPCSGSVQLDTVGSEFPTVLSVHSGCPGTTSNSLVCDSSTGDGTSARVTLPVSSGATYYVRVSGDDGAAGKFVLNIGACGSGGCAADFNGDGKLNINDFIAFQSAWQKKDARADFNHDGKYTVNDFIAFQAAFVRGC